MVSYFAIVKPVTVSSGELRNNCHEIGRLMDLRCLCVDVLLWDGLESFSLETIAIMSAIIVWYPAAVAILMLECISELLGG